MMIKRLLYLRNTFASLAVLLVLLVSGNGFGQTTIFTENMGAGSGTLTIAANTFQNNATLTYSGDADTRVTTPSDIYAGFSGSRNVFITNTIGRFFQIASINTSGYTSLSLSFGVNKSSTASNGSDLIVEVSSDGISYTPLTYTLTSGQGTAGTTWQYKTPTGTIPVTANLRIRFRQNGTATQYRIDDVKLVGTAAVAASTTLADNGTPITAGNITQGTNNNILGSFTLAQNGANSTLTSASFLIDGNFVNGDVSANGIKLYTSATNNFATATLLGSVSVTVPAVITFSGLTQTLTKDATRYFWVTADIAIGATPENTINLFEFDSEDIIVNNGVVSGNTTTTGTKTIVATVSPTISLSDASLPNFDNVCINTESTIKEYLVEGVNLTNDIIITAPTGFKIRKEGDVAYSTTVTLTPTAGEVLEIIEVIFNPTVAGASGSLNITHTSTGATPKNVSVSGTTASGTVTLTSNTASAVTTTSATSGGNTLSTTCGTITAKGVVWDTDANPTVALSTKTNDGTGVANYSSNITGLTENTVYNVRAYATNSNGETGYGSNQTFTTLSKAPTAATANTATVNGFTASWTAPASQGNAALTYTVKIYSNAALTTQVGSAITGITGTSTVITSLSQNTTYYYTVEAVNATGSSVVAGFTTGITTLSGPCLTENFTSWSHSYGDWTHISNGTWTAYNTYAGNNQIQMNDVGDYLELPPLNNPVQIKYDGAISSSAQATPDKIKIQYFDGLSWIDVDEHTATSTSFMQFSTSLPSNVQSMSNVRIRLYRSSDNRTHYIDNVEIFCGIPCEAPTVTLQATPVTAITTETVSLHGNVTAQGGFAINTRGFEYSVNNTMSAAVTKSSAATSTGNYSENLTGLTPNTVYYFRALAINDCSPNKTGYSHTSGYPTFLTLPNAPVVSTGTGANSSSFTAQWSAPAIGGNAEITYEIEVDDDSNFGSVNFTASNISGLSTLVNSGLSASTTYYYRVRANNATGNSVWSATSVGYATTAPAPEIIIKQGNTSIASASTFDIGNQISGTTGSAITFTIENTGNANLSVGTLSKSGADAGLFTITQPLDSSVAASGTTTFTVTFNPTSTGSKTTQLSLINGDSDENPYIINLTGTGTRSEESVVKIDPTFTGSNAINYLNHTGSDVTHVNSYEAGRFIVYDGNGVTLDSDNLATILNSITFNVSGSAALSRIAIYDGTQEISEISGSTPAAFSSLNVSIPDGEYKTLSVRVLFNTSSITDKQLIKFSLFVANASTSGSSFGTSGSQQTPDQNIEVTADRLAFTTHPTNTGINTPMASVVVAAVDINNNKDADATGEISLTSTGTMTVTPLTETLVNGAATFTNIIIHSVAQSGINLIASKTGFAALDSNLFDVTEIVYVNGDYRSKTPGTWTNHATLPGNATWQRYKASISDWEDVSTEPTGTAGTYTVYINHDITIPAGGTQQYATGKIHIVSGAKLNFEPTGTNWTFRNIIVENGATLQMDGRFTVLASGEFEILDGGTFIYNYSSNPSSGLTGSVWNGIEKFHPDSNFIIKANDGTGNFLPATTSLSSSTFNGSTAYFGNLIVNYNTRITSGNFNSPMLTHGNLEFITLANYSLLDANYNWTIGKNLILNSASVGNLTLISGNIGILNIKGNVINNSNKIINLNNSTGTMTLNVDGNITLDGLSGCTMNINNGGTSVLNLKGDLTVESTAQLISTSAGTSFNFTGIGDGLSNLTTQNIAIIPSTATNINFNVKANAYVKLNNNLALGSGSKLTVENGGTFNFGFNDTTPLIISGSAFESQANARIKITSPDGIASSDATGNLRTTTRTYGAADYQYIGITNQITGTGLPTFGAKISSSNSGTAPNNEVLLTNTPTLVSALDITNGVFNLNEKTLSGTALSVKDNATLKIVGTDTFPTFSTRDFNNFPNGIVEYGGSNQSIAALTSPAYPILKVSGTGKKTLSTSTVEVGNSVTVSASLLEISQGQTLRVQNEITTVDTDATNGLFIKNGGSLVQTTEVNNQTSNVNTGKIKMERITKPMYRLDYTYWSAPVSGNTLVALSPNSPANRFFHWNPDAISPAPNWAVITGGTAQMIPGKGYIIRAPNVGNGIDPTIEASYTPFNGYFNGKPNNGTVSTPISGPEKWNLIGNPYPSSIDAEKFLEDNASIDGTLYFWTHNTPLTVASGYGYAPEDYASWNLTGSVGTAATSETNPAENKPNGFVAAGQSFFVKGLSNGNAVFTNSMRENANNMQFFRSENTEKHRVWLNLKGAEKGFSQTLVGYVSNATNDQDVRFDGEMFGGNTVTFYSVMDNKNWTIQGRALPFTTSDEVPLGYKTTLSGNLIISIDDKDGLLATQTIYLKDNLLNVVHNLTESPYTFASVPGTFDDRFVLRYLPGQDLDNPTFKDQIEGVTIRKNNADLYINSVYETIDAILIFDITGRLLFEKENCNTNSFKASHITQSEQTLIVKVRLNNGGVITKKVW